MGWKSRQLLNALPAVAYAADGGWPVARWLEAGRLADGDSTQLEAVLRGECTWKSQVANFTPAGAKLVEHGDEVAARAASSRIPVADVVHGDHSSSHFLFDAMGRVRFVDCDTVSRGTRVRDLADLYRQSFVYPLATSKALSLLSAEATAVEGAQVFAKCAVAVTYSNLAWWVEHKTSSEFDQACTRLHELFEDVRGGSA